MAKETLMYRTVFWTLWERERVGWFGRMVLKHVYHIWNESLVQVRCTILDAWGWCTGMTQRDGTGREEGGGFKMGNTCIPVADSYWLWQNQYNIVKLKNKIKKKKKQSPSPHQSLRFLLPLSPCPQGSNKWTSFKCIPALGPFHYRCFSLDPYSFTPSFSNFFYSFWSLLKSHLLRHSLGPSI